MATTAIPGLPAFAFPSSTDRQQTWHCDAREGSLPAAGAEMKALIVDDSAVSRKLVERALSGQPYSLLFAATGQQAVECYVRHKPSLVIMGGMMSDLDGVEVCRRMRSLCRDFYTHIILLTSQTEKASVVEGLEAGADGYLTKPFHERELIARVGVAFRAAEFHRKVQLQNKTLESLALTDAMTGLPNRRAIDEWAGRELGGAARHGAFPLWVIIADLDRFKYVNDTFGHEAGDAVLKKFSKILRAHSRRGDLCARLGGEEFLLVMAHASREDVQKAADRIRADFEMTPFTFRGCSMVATASFGIAGTAYREQPTFSALLSQADAALYCAKRNGRNRIEIAAPSL
jgi:two-component system, cell cycle response regulator